jgi:hypothetical protein
MRGPLLLLAVTLGLGVAVGSAEPPAGEPGDVYWQFVPNGLMADQRVRDALVLLTDAGTVAEDAGLEGDLLYGDARTAEFVATSGVEEASLLLMAAGIGVPAQGVVQARPCRFWTPEDGDLRETRENVGLALGEVLAKVLFDIGIEADLCEATSDQDAADILIWEYGQDYSIPEETYYPDGNSFLALEIELPGAVPGGTGGGSDSDVSPPATGDGGLR